jgi:protein involved in polysaccharide export with SLBB domain
MRKTRTIRTIAATFLLAVASLLPVLAQTREAAAANAPTAPLDLKERLGLRAKAAAEATSPVALEGILDPASYRVAPGDRLVVGIWGAADLELELLLGADGGLVIPSVGVVALGGSTLEQAAGKVRAACATAYPRSAITLTLARPGMLRIPITGQVIAAGTYEILSSFRLADLVQVAGGLSSGADTRNILITHRDGTQSTSDLLAWLADGSLAGNPVLETGDRVQVPPAIATYRVRGVFPEGVEAATTTILDRPFRAETRAVPARSGDRLDFVLRAAGWPGANACTEIVRLETPGRDRREVRLADAAATELEPGDAIEIPFCREWISVNGSIVRPGFYPYLPGQKVADYVYLAGGPTELGRNSGWKTIDAAGQRHSAAPTDSVAAGARIWVPNRRYYTISTMLTPLGTAVAVIVSLVALASK